MLAWNVKVSENFNQCKIKKCLAKSDFCERKHPLTCTEYGETSTHILLEIFAK